MLVGGACGCLIFCVYFYFVRHTEKRRARARGKEHLTERDLAGCIWNLNVRLRERRRRQFIFIIIVCMYARKQQASKQESCERGGGV